MDVGRGCGLNRGGVQEGVHDRHRVQEGVHDRHRVGFRQLCLLVALHQGEEEAALGVLGTM